MIGSSQKKTDKMVILSCLLLKTLSDKVIAIKKKLKKYELESEKLKKVVLSFFFALLSLKCFCSCCCSTVNERN